MVRGRFWDQKLTVKSNRYVCFLENSVADNCKTFEGLLFLLYIKTRLKVNPSRRKVKYSQTLFEQNFSFGTGVINVNLINISFDSN